MRLGLLAEAHLSNLKRSPFSRVGLPLFFGETRADEEQACNHKTNPNKKAWDKARIHPDANASYERNERKNPDANHGCIFFRGHDSLLFERVYDHLRFACGFEASLALRPVRPSPIFLASVERAVA